ncbi:hypothetical protein ERHA54_35060 [Erwinia rhapontici]|uniref:head-tail adaptor n=1 Tax=Erwinia rhapontici TaxID=55212 RepID=UPI001BB3BAC4|nr:head-tail adaptor [Erwinia rhapontici]BCQ40903.1 hypothetical protein ERHA54_35060 [Erwinia rhapontici]
MPTLDMTDVLLSPEFLDTTLIVTRRQQTVDDDGYAANNETSEGFAGVVTVDRALEYQMLQAGRVISGAIFIATLTQLIAGETERDADIVTYQNRKYFVKGVDPYTAYGAGFVQAHCILIPFDGGKSEQ